MRLFQKQTEHEKKEMIFEVLAPLAENGNFSFFIFISLLSSAKCLVWEVQRFKTPNSERLQCSLLPLDKDLDEDVHLLCSKLSSKCESCVPG